MAGLGSELAIVAAYILADELHRADGDYAKAFASYQGLFAPFIRQKQEAALRFRVLFGPKSKAAMFVRNQVMNPVRFPWVARAATTDKPAAQVIQKTIYVWPPSRGLPATKPRFAVVDALARPL
jgi:2-polyprenyl-6-methoxyphenol hydroxylase-like FAD-dependent oxidoreductase